MRIRVTEESVMLSKPSGCWCKKCLSVLTRIDLWHDVIALALRGGYLM